VSLVSDKGTAGNIGVEPDGSVSFGTGSVPELSNGIPLTGSGARVTPDPTGVGMVCAFTVDTDLTGTDGSQLHVSGGLTVHWHPEGWATSTAREARPASAEPYISRC
jgi:hypothetical protein